MMFELFPDGPVYEFPEVINVIFSFAWAFVLASLIALTHRITFTGRYYPKNFFQSLILGSIVTTMVMMAIGDSLARGLGVFGAMAIIRFRTRIDDPRDVLFLFAALSTGLAIGVYGFTISFVGAILFSAVALLLHYSPFRNPLFQHELHFTLRDSQELDNAIDIIKKHSPYFRQTRVQVKKENLMLYQYAITISRDSSHDDLINELKGVEGISQLQISLNNNHSEG